MEYELENDSINDLNLIQKYILQEIFNNNLTINKLLAINRKI
jgi:hypothetical protein